MWGQALDTAVGLTFLFAVTALFCSAVVEGYAQLTQRRARYLITALRNMLDAPESTSGGARTGVDPDAIFAAVRTPEAPRAAAAHLDAAAPAGAATEDAVVQSLTTALFDHPLVRSLQTRKVRPGTDGAVRNPQYIPPRLFARALVSTLLPNGAPPGDPNLLPALRSAVDGLPGDLPARRSLLALVDQSEGRLETFQQSLEDWYDGEMDRISGWYKRWAQAVLLVVGLVVAVLANVDTVNVTHVLWVDGPVRAAVVAEATSGTLCNQQGDPNQRIACAQQEIGRLQGGGLPIGQPAGCQPGNWKRWDACLVTSYAPRNDAAAFLLKLIGWLLTAVAVSFGAPFWFEALSRLGNLRSTGPKPAAG